MWIGIDLGGTKIEGVALEAGGAVRHRLRVATPRGDYDGTVAAVRSVVTALERDAGRPCSVGVGIPGTLSPLSGRVKNANSTWLIGRPLQQDLEAALDRPVRLANDANCFALSEASDGAAAGADVVFGVILGTGCGAGIVVRGQVLTGPNGIAGEWGHNPLPAPEPGEWPGPPCYCGRTGCVETFLAGPGLARDYTEAGGGAADAAEIARRAAAGEGVADACLARYERRLARALTAVLNILDPDVVVLGGGLSNIERLYLNVAPLLHPFGGEPPRTRIVRARHGDSSGVRGAAWLWPEGAGPASALDAS
ncbi:MAG TPA: ROK family protein [Vicinamibacterales bacterium]|nr:ROK family protein [Vicinamibacterales bacterium]